MNASCYGRFCSKASFVISVRNPLIQ
jgi:hypothetical protein